MYPSTDRCETSFIYGLTLFVCAMILGAGIIIGPQERPLDANGMQGSSTARPAVFIEVLVPAAEAAPGTLPI